MKKEYQSNRLKILDAAEELIVESGFEAVKISRIAKKAGVADSLAYKFFKGKDEIIFSIVAERIKEDILLIQESLQEISDPRLMLREVIGHMLKYNASHRKHVKNLLLQCRSNKNFYKSDAYSSIKKYESIISSILKQGAEEGVFRNDINMNIIVNMILGTVDVEALNDVLNSDSESDEGTNDLDSIMSLLFSALARREKPINGDRKQVIMSAAEKIFAKEGFAKAKTASIAKMACVAEGAIYDYFTSKEELLFAISDKYLDIYLGRISNIFDNKKATSSSVKKLWALMSSFCLTFLADRDYMKIYFTNIFFNIRYYENHRARIMPNYNEFNNIFDNLIEEGKRDGSIRDDVDPRTFRFMFMGAYTHLVLRWIIIEHREFDKYTEIRNLMILLLTAVLKEPPPQKYLINVAF